jgi:probable O-glycosylation ligase (exosortase A-associated)
VWANYHYFVLKTYPITGPGPAIGLGGGIFADRNDFCMFLSMSIIICWYLAFLTKRWVMRMMWVALLPFLLHAILLTESRGGLLGAGLAFMYIAWRSKRRKLMFVGVAAGLAVALLFFTNDALMARYGTIGNYEQDASALGRLNSWRTGWRIMWGNPLFGVGLENYLEVFYDYSDYQPTWVLQEGVWQIQGGFDYEVYQARQAHNMWIQRGGETGVLGALILLWFVLSIPADSRRVRKWLAELKDIGKLDEDRHRRALLLAYCIEGTLIPYLVTGFFLSMEDFEGLYVLGLMTACLTAWCRQMRAEAGLSAAPRRAKKTVTAVAPVAAQRPRPRWTAGAGGG